MFGTLLQRKTRASVIVVFSRNVLVN